MKKTAVVMILLGLVLFGASLGVYAQSQDFDFHKMFDDNGAIMLVSDARTGSIEYANKAAARFYGYSTAQLETMYLSEIDLLSPEETNAAKRAASNEERNYYESKHRLANGEIRMVEVYSSPQTIGGRECIFSVIYDITARSQLELIHVKLTDAFNIILVAIIVILSLLSAQIYSESRKSKEKSLEISNFNELRSSFLDSYDNFIYLKDENFNYVFLNKALEKFFIKESSEIIGRNDYSLADEDFAGKMKATDTDVYNNMSVREDIFNWKNRFFKTIKFPVRLVSGFYGVGAYIEDVTEEHNDKIKLEKNLLRNQILVSALNRNFDSTQDQFDFVLNESLKLTESKFGCIYFYDENSSEFSLVSLSKDVIAGYGEDGLQEKHKLAETDLLGKAVRLRKPVVENDGAIQAALEKEYPGYLVTIERFMSVPVMIDDEIVAVVGLANKESDYDDNDIYQITALMNGIWYAKERREGLARLAVERNKHLQTLISIGDGVMVVDLEGKITMLNRVAEKLTGWPYKEALGRHYREVFLLSHEDGRSSINDPIEGVLTEDKVQEMGNHAILTSRDGTVYNLEDSAAPIKDDKESTVGVVLVFRDVTEKKEQRSKIDYLSVHDSLTGLYNRIFFEEELKRLDTGRNLPITLIVGDMNGLKLTNDIFGHAAGDLLLNKAARVLKMNCRADDIIARIGGDEFTILLPRTDAEEASKIISRIKSQLEQESVKAIKGSISMGCDTKTGMYQDITRTLENAEARMYAEKTLDHINAKSGTIKTIIGSLHKASAKEGLHSENVSRINESLGKYMVLPEAEVKKLKESGYLHDIGKIILDEALIGKTGELTEDEKKKLRQHPLVGYRILNSFAETLDIAEIVLAHHEKWDGSGYPRGLKGEEIPLLSRILAVSESYDDMTNRLNHNSPGKEEALNEIRKMAGTRFDPKIVQMFSECLRKHSEI